MILTPGTGSPDNIYSEQYDIYTTLTATLAELLPNCLAARANEANNMHGWLNAIALEIEALHYVIYAASRNAHPATFISSMSEWGYILALPELDDMRVRSVRRVEDSAELELYTDPFQFLHAIKPSALLFGNVLVLRNVALASTSTTITGHYASISLTSVEPDTPVFYSEDNWASYEAIEPEALEGLSAYTLDDLVTDNGTLAIFYYPSGREVWCGSDDVIRVNGTSGIREFNLDYTLSEDITDYRRRWSAPVQVVTSTELASSAYGSELASGDTLLVYDDDNMTQVVVKAVSGERIYLQDALTFTFPSGAIAVLLEGSSYLLRNTLDVYGTKLDMPRMEFEKNATYKARLLNRLYERPDGSTIELATRIGAPFGLNTITGYTHKVSILTATALPASQVVYLVDTSWLESGDAVNFDFQDYVYIVDQVGDDYITITEPLEFQVKAGALVTKAVTCSGANHVRVLGYQTPLFQEGFYGGVWLAQGSGKRLWYTKYRPCEDKDAWLTTSVYDIYESRTTGSQELLTAQGDKRNLTVAASDGSYVINVSTTYLRSGDLLLIHENDRHERIKVLEVLSSTSLLLELPLSGAYTTEAVVERWYALEFDEQGSYVDARQLGDYVDPDVHNLRANLWLYHWKIIDNKWVVFHPLNLAENFGCWVYSTPVWFEAIDNQFLRTMTSLERSTIVDQLNRVSPIAYDYVSWKHAILFAPGSTDQPFIDYVPSLLR